MTNTKANIIKVMEAKKKNLDDLWSLTKDAEERRILSLESMHLQEALWLLTDKEYFNSVAEIYGITE